MKKYSILIVDDEPRVLTSIQRVLRKKNYNIYTALNATEGLEILKKHFIQLIISDQMMPGMNGTEFLRLVRERFPHIVRILLTAHTDMENALDAINQSEVFRFISKPWVNEDLVMSIERGLEHYEMQQDVKRLMAVFRSHRDILNKLPICQEERMENGALVISDEDVEDDNLDELIQKYWSHDSLS